MLGPPERGLNDPLPIMIMLDTGFIVSGRKLELHFGSAQPTLVPGGCLEATSSHAREDQTCSVSL